jgi:hypothetical protein
MQQAPGPTVDPGLSIGRVFRTLAILVVVGGLVFGAISLLRNSGGDSGDDGASPTPAPTRVADQRFPMQPGVTAVVVAGYNADQLSTVTLGETIDGFTHPSNQFQAPEAGNRWWGIYLAIENTGTADTISLRYKLRLEGQAEYDPRFIAGVPGMIEYTYSDLTPGARKEGWLYFEIPAGAEIDALRVDGRNGPRGEQPPAVYFETP